MQRRTLLRSVLTFTLSALAAFVVVQMVRFPTAILQSPTLVGRWEVEFTLSDGRSHKIQFDAQASGNGSFLLLDAQSSLNPPPVSTKAVWSQSDPIQVTFSGDIEFPIGNVGRDPGRLSFSGVFDSSETISGEVIFSSTVAAGVTKAGAFTARRVADSLAVELRVPNLSKSRRLRRGSEVSIEWEVRHRLPILTQHLFLSTDGGESFLPMAPLLEGEIRSFTWAIPKSLGKTKKAVIKVVVIDTAGNTASDTTDRAFRIK